MGGWLRGKFKTIRRLGSIFLVFARARYKNIRLLPIKFMNLFFVFGINYGKRG